MNKKIKYIIITLIILLLIAISIILTIKYIATKQTDSPITEPSNTSEENIMVIGMDKTKENETTSNTTEEPTTEKEPEPEPAKDA